MPVYNAARFLPAALDSILAQSWPCWELIGVDDGSKDTSWAILKEYSQRDSRVRPVHCEHGGIAAARKTALAHAHGEFLANLDADDVALPDRLRLQLGYLQSHPECVALGGRALQIDEDGDPIGALPVRLTHQEIEAEALTGRGLCLIHSAAMIRASTMAAAGGYRDGLSVAEDLDLYLRLAERGTLANLPEVLLHVRRHANSTSARFPVADSLALKRQIIAEALRRRGRASQEVEIRSFFEPKTAEAVYARWALQATSAGYDATARKYLARLWQSQPLSARTWTTLAGVAARRAARWLPRSLVDRIRAARSI